jgi:lipopolysaccharide transport system permease protein
MRMANVAGQVEVAARPPLKPSFGLLDTPAALYACWRRRDLLWHMFVRHLRSQYKQSVLAYAWAFVNPLSQMIILTLVFSRLLAIGKGDTGGVPFSVFLFVGLVPWIFFSAALASATDSVVNASNLVTKVYFPREILPLAALLTKVVDLAVGMVILAGLMVLQGQSPQWTSWWFPVLFGIHFIFTLGLSLPLAALNLYFHDVRFLVGVALTLWFYMTPIIYPESFVNQRAGSLKFIFEVNPNYLFVNAYRRVLLAGESPGLDRVALGLLIALGAFFVGYYLFKKMEPGFADHI